MADFVAGKTKPLENQEDMRVRGRTGNNITVPGLTSRRSVGPSPSRVTLQEMQNLCCCAAGGLLFSVILTKTSF